MSDTAKAVAGLGPASKRATRFTSEELATIRQRFSYDRQTGIVSYAVKVGGRLIGAPAGGMDSSGYLRIKVGPKTVAVHRVAYFLGTGSWPDGEVDHINGNKLDNSIANLRVVDPATNSQNQLHRRNAESGCLGVTKHGRGWQAVICARKKAHYLGTFDTKEEAAAAYQEARKRLHPLRWTGFDSGAMA